MSTIFALATPHGRSGVAVIRISGPEALAAARHFGYCGTPEPRKAIYHHLKIASHRVIESSDYLDSGLLLYFPAPHSFTGENCLEFQTHGSIAVIRRMLAELSALPSFRMAEPGEFARRAFLNGKLDLTAAEGLVDLIEAETEAQRRQATRASLGESARFFNGLRAQIMQPLALLEAVIDFPEEEIPAAVLARIEAETLVTIRAIDTALSGLAAAEKIRDGFSVVILGAPNAGKSTLMNALAKRDVAIVSDRAGTTRDVLEVHLDLGGFSVVLVDTAGLRETADSIESEGIRRALDRAARADIRLVLFDATRPPDPASQALVDATAITVYTKADIAEPIEEEDQNSIAIAATNPKTLSPLLEKLKERLGLLLPPEEAHYVTRQRHQNHLIAAKEELEKSRLEDSLELKGERLRLAATEIGKITGAIQVDELLGIIFSSFCIGK